MQWLYCIKVHIGIISYQVLGFPILLNSIFFLPGNAFQLRTMQNIVNWYNLGVWAECHLLALQQLEPIK